MDDEPGIRRVLTTMLEHLGYEPIAVEEGKKAVELYRKAMEAGDPFVAVILDLTIRGGLGGLETLERLLEIDPDARVVATTGYSTEGVVGQHERFGFKASLAKPFKLKKLAAVLDEVLAASGSLA
jgi:CheY-like chemotaxis protein